MIRTKGSQEQEDIVQAIRHMRMMNQKFAAFKNLPVRTNYMWPEELPSTCEN